MVTTHGSPQFPLVPKLVVFVFSVGSRTARPCVAMPQAFWGRSRSSEEEMLKQRTKYDFTIFAFVSPGDLLLLELSLWCVRNLFAISVSSSSAQ